ncbi:MAG TPA: hypothetical protein VH234_03310 [Candidatus Saccharimonadales bacterium]|nr:hypothetical protein [Candidatus Saccharimonadales bacterium]
MDSEDKPPETKIAVQDDSSPEESIQTISPQPAQAKEDPVSVVETPAEQIPEAAAPLVAEIPSLSEQPPEESEHQVEEASAQTEEQAPAEPEQYHEEALVPPETAIPELLLMEHNASPDNSKKVLMLTGIGVLFIVVVAVVVLLMGIHNKTPRPLNPQPVVTAVQYIDPQTGFKIMRPANWANVAPAAGSGDSIEFQDPQADPINSSAAYHPIITVSDASANGSSLAQVVNNVNASLAKQAPGYKSLTTTPETVGGSPATLLTYSYNLSGLSLTFPVTADELVVIKNDTGYILRGVVLSSAWAQHKTVIETSLLSFQP